ncbi:hypothetical protein KW797_00060 [Candidatus Parcubacteria bacterium]|nr:hypothetical protein [Candidatus Parcubacteria bacterium]
MGSMPDFEQAHRLNPDRFPKDPMKQIEELNRMLSYAVDLLASETKQSPSAIMESVRKSVLQGKLPQVAAEPKAGSEQAAVKSVEKDRAGFYGNVERSTYYPMSEYPTGDVDESKMRFFQTADEAEANGFTAPVSDTGTTGGEEESDDEEKPKAKAKKKK